MTTAAKVFCPLLVHWGLKHPPPHQLSAQLPPRPFLKSLAAGTQPSPRLPRCSALQLMHQATRPRDIQALLCPMTIVPRRSLHHHNPVQPPPTLFRRTTLPVCHCFLQTRKPSEESLQEQLAIPRNCPLRLLPIRTNPTSTRLNGRLEGFPRSGHSRHLVSV